MKRFLFAGLLLVGLSGVAIAQDDDIYATGHSRKEAALNDTMRRSNDDVYQRERYDDNNNRNNFNRGNDGTSDAYSSYDNPNEYIDDSDEVSYSSRINRFNYSFSSMGYYNVFYNPFWYDRYWYDPYMGWNPWRPHFGVSFGIGPCWSSAWGYSSWYGYGAFNSYWYYPSYGCGWNNYYGGNYWNRYYNNVDYRNNNNYTNHYGPRQVAGTGFRPAYRQSGSGLRQSNPGNYGGGPRQMANNAQAAPNPGMVRGNNGGRNGSFQSDNQSNAGPRGGNSEARQNGNPRGFSRIFGGGNRGNSDVRANGGNAGQSRGGFFGGGNRGGGSVTRMGGGGNVTSGRSFGGGGTSGGGGGRSSGGGGHSGGGGGRGRR